MVGKAWAAPLEQENAQVVAWAFFFSPSRPVRGRRVARPIFQPPIRHRCHFAICRAVRQEAHRERLQVVATTTMPWYNGICQERVEKSLQNATERRRHMKQQGKRQVIILDVSRIPSSYGSLGEMSDFIESLKEGSVVYDAELLDRTIKVLNAPVEVLERKDFEVKQTNLTVTKTVKELLDRYKVETEECPSAFLQRMIQDHLRYGRPVAVSDGVEIDDEVTDTRIGLTLPAIDLDVLRWHKLQTGESGSAFLRRMVYALLMPCNEDDEPC